MCSRIPGQNLERTRLETLFKILWNKNDSLHDKIFTDFEVQVPEFGVDQDTETSSATFRKLSLDQVISDYEHNNNAQLSAAGPLLPCRKDRLLIRKAYEELYRAIRAGEASRPGDRKRVRSEDGSVVLVADRNLRQEIEKVFLVIGHPGIGKTIFLSYLLVLRLLLGEPTIVQLAERLDGATDIANAVHYLIDDGGVRLMDEAVYVEASRDSRIWVLADQKPVGYPRQLHNHQWLVVVSASPIVDGLKSLVKEYAPRQYVMSTWDWGEIAAAALVPVF